MVSVPSEIVGEFLGVYGKEVSNSLFQFCSHSHEHSRHCGTVQGWCYDQIFWQHCVILWKPIFYSLHLRLPNHWACFHTNTHPHSHIQAHTLTHKYQSEHSRTTPSLLLALPCPPSERLSDLSLPALPGSLPLFTDSKRLHSKAL